MDIPLAHQKAYAVQQNECYKVKSQPGASFVVLKNGLEPLQ
jgi:hypothetical protein